MVLSPELDAGWAGPPLPHALGMQPRIPPRLPQAAVPTWRRQLEVTSAGPAVTGWGLAAPGAVTQRWGWAAIT